MVTLDEWFQGPQHPNETVTQYHIICVYYRPLKEGETPKGGPTTVMAHFASTANLKEKIKYANKFLPPSENEYRIDSGLIVYDSVQYFVKLRA